MHDRAAPLFYFLPPTVITSIILLWWWRHPHLTYMQVLQMAWPILAAMLVVVCVALLVADRNK